MASVQGVVASVRLEQERSNVVLRFVLQTDHGERIPVEMRGREVSGFLNDGDRVQLDVRGGQVRDRDGVAHPNRINNLSTSSIIRAKSQGCLGSLVKSAFGFIASIALSAGSGVLVAILTNIFLPKSVLLQRSLIEPQSRSPLNDIINNLGVTALVVGGIAALLVFLLIYVLPRLLRHRT